MVRVIPSAAWLEVISSALRVLLHAMHMYLITDNGGSTFMRVCTGHCVKTNFFVQKQFFTGCVSLENEISLICHP
jgi:hypothetical protein